MTKPSRPTSNGREEWLGSSLRVLMAFIAQNPPMPMGTIVASEPPANMTWASPILRTRQASPMAWLEVAHADARADEDADLVAILLFEIQPRIEQGLVPSRDSKLREQVRPARLLGR